MTQSSRPRSRGLRFLAVGAAALLASTWAGVLPAGAVAAGQTVTFDEVEADGEQPVTNEFAAKGVTFAGTDDPGHYDGISQGDPGGWGLEGTNGSQFIGFNGESYTTTATLDQTVESLSIDAARSSGSGAGSGATLTALLDGEVVDTVSVTFGDINVWQTLTVEGPLDSFTLTGTGTGFHPFGADNLVIGPATAAATVDAGPDVEGFVNEPVALDGTISDEFGTVTTTWTSSDPACTFADPAAVDTTVTCTKEGEFTFTLTATNEEDATASDSTTGTISKPYAQGYRLVAADGGIFTFGDRRFHGSTGDIELNAPILGGATDIGDYDGYWIVAADGGVFAFNAPFFGSLGDEDIDAPAVEIEPTPSGQGYWIVLADGSVYEFGDAEHFGDMAGEDLNQPIIGMSVTSTGLGYWLVGEDGGIFSFGDADFHGSMGDRPLNAPIIDLAPAVDNNGYYLVGLDGGVFAFGSAEFKGSTGNITLNDPVVAMLVAPNGAGYWLAATDGGVFTFGAVDFLGSMGCCPLNAPVLDMIH